MNFRGSDDPEDSGDVNTKVGQLQKLQLATFLSCSSSKSRAPVFLVQVAQITICVDTADA